MGILCTIKSHTEEGIYFFVWGGGASSATQGKPILTVSRKTRQRMSGEGRSGEGGDGVGERWSRGSTWSDQKNPGYSHDGCLMFHNWLPRNNTHMHTLALILSICSSLWQEHSRLGQVQTSTLPSLTLELGRDGQGHKPHGPAA